MQTVKKTKDRMTLFIRFMALLSRGPVERPVGCFLIKRLLKEFCVKIICFFFHVKVKKLRVKGIGNVHKTQHPSWASKIPQGEMIIDPVVFHGIDQDIVTDAIVIKVGYRTGQKP